MVKTLGAGLPTILCPSLSHYLEHNIPHPVPCIALYQGQVLPGPHGDLPRHEGDGDKGRQQRRLDVGGTVVIMPCLMVPIGYHPALLIQVGREYIQRRLQIMVHHARFKLQSGQARHAAGGEAGNGAGADAVFFARLG